MQNIIKYQLIIKFKKDIMGNLECTLDISDIKDIKIINIIDHDNNYMLEEAAHIVYKLNGSYKGSFIKKEHHEFMRNNHVLEVPSEWSEDICLDNMDLITSMSVNNFFNLSSEDWEYTHYIDGEEIKIKTYSSIDDILDREKEFVIKDISHFAINEQYEKLQKQEAKIRGKK